jgi:hypothetical protein
MNNGGKKSLAKIIGQAIFYSSIQAAIGSVEMSSRFSVINFSKDQETLQNAADSLMSYMYVALAWAIATILVLYSEYGPIGAIMGILANSIYICWIYFSYIKAFKKAATKYGLQEPTLNFF